MLSAGALLPAAAPRAAAPYAAPRCQRPSSSSRPILRVAAVPSPDTSIRRRGHTTARRASRHVGGVARASAGGAGEAAGASVGAASAVLRLTSAAEVTALLEVGTSNYCPPHETRLPSADPRGTR